MAAGTSEDEARRRCFDHLTRRPQPGGPTPLRSQSEFLAWERYAGDLHDDMLYCNGRIDPWVCEDAPVRIDRGGCLRRPDPPLDL